MKAPSLKRLLETFSEVTRNQADLIRALAHAADDREKLRTLIETHCPETDKYARSCFHDPYRSSGWRRTLVMHAIDYLLGTGGVEPLGPVDMHNGPPFEYCNTGDTYAATLIFCRDADEIRIGSWGDYAERIGEESEAE